MAANRCWQRDRGQQSRLPRADLGGQRRYPARSRRQRRWWSGGRGGEGEFGGHGVVVRRIAAVLIRANDLG